MQSAYTRALDSDLCERRGGLMVSAFDSRSRALSILYFLDSIYDENAGCIITIARKVTFIN